MEVTGTQNCLVTYSTSFKISYFWFHKKKEWMLVTKRFHVPLSSIVVWSIPWKSIGRKQFGYQHSSKYLLFSWTEKKQCWYQTVLGPVVFHSIFCIYYVPMGHNSFSLPTFFIIFILCSTEESKSYRFAKTLGGVNYRIEFFGGLYLKWKWVTRALQ